MTKISQWVTTMASETPGSTVSLVGQGSFLDKSSLHMVGYMGKNPNPLTTPHDEWCPMCKSKGRSQALKTYRINFTQSIFLCSNPQCIFPLGYTPLDNIIANTVELKKNSSPVKQKKRNISEVLPAPLPSGRRPKTSRPTLEECLSRNDSPPSTQTDWCTSAPVYPTLPCKMSPPRTSHCSQTKGSNFQVPNVSRSANSFSGFTSVLCKTPAVPVVPTGSHSADVCDQSEALHADQDMFQGRVSPNEIVEMMDMLNNGPLFFNCVNPNTENISETGIVGSSEDRDQKTLNQSSETENTGAFNGNPGVLKDDACSPDHLHLFKPTAPPPVLPHDQLGTQVKENSPKEVPSPPCSGVDAVPDPGNDFFMESALSQSCEFVQKDHGERIESCLLEHTQPGQLVEDMSIDLDSGYPDASQWDNMSPAHDLIQDSQTRICESTVSPGLQHEELVQERKVNSLVEMSPPTSNLAGAVEENIVNTDVSPLDCGLSEPRHLVQDGCKRTSGSHSLQDTQPVFPTEDNSLMDVYEPPCTTVSVVKDNLSVKLAAASLQVCRLSLPQHMVEDIKKNQCRSTTPRSSEGLQPECLSKDNSLENVSEASCTSASVVNDTCNENVACKSLPDYNFSELQEMVQDCQKSNSETTNPSHSLQDILPDCQSEDKSLRTVHDTHSTAVSAANNGPSVNSATVSFPDSPLLESVDLTHNCKKQDLAKPSHSLEDIQSVCHPEDSSFMDVCDHLCTTTTAVNPSNVDADVSSLTDISLSEPQNLIQDSPKRLCETSTPSMEVQAAHTLDKNSTIEVSGSSCEVTAVVDNAGNGNASVRLLSDNFLDSQMDICEAVTPNSQTNNLLAKESSPLCNAGAANEDISDVTPAASRLSDTELSAPKPGNKKNLCENQVLPDLLLDIHELRREEPLSATSSPASKEPASMTFPSETELQEGDLSQEEPDKQYNGLKHNEVTETSSTVTNPDGLHDSKLNTETTLNTESFGEDESMDATSVEPTQVPKIPRARTGRNTQRHLQWKNKHSLCWLDCIFSSLVQSEMLNNVVAEADNKESIIHNLFTRYDEATAMLTNITKRKAGGTKKSEKCLNEVRLHIFEKLKPLLKCKLGRKESPVFAFPLLLKQDPEFEKLFMHSYMWNFNCDCCGYTYQQRCQKTLTTFTKVLPNWQPLNAVHKSPCNKCNTEQKRSMHLETLNSVFMVHFVEGLPSNDLKEYSFQFKGHLYEIKTIIRYGHEHFSTWIASDDGTWLEADGLRGSFCRRQKKFNVRARNIHIVIWERNNKTTGEENSLLSTAEYDHSELTSTNPSTSPQDQNPHPASTEAPGEVTPAAVDLNTSNPLAGMEAYADDDIITLTLVEIPLDPTGQPIESHCDLKPPDTYTAQNEANQKGAPYAAPLTVPISLPLLQHGDQRHGPCSPPVSTNSIAQTLPSAEDCNPPSSVQESSSTNLTFNMRAVATSTPVPQSYSTKKSIVGSWITTLLNKDQSLLNSSLYASKTTPASKPCPPLKVTDLSGAPKKAQNFHSFQARGVNKSANSEGSHVFQAPKEKPAPLVKTPLTSSATSHLKPGNNVLDYGTLLKDGSLSSEDKIRKLRHKLLKKLKAKKNDLATLERIAKTQQPRRSDQLPQINRKEHLQGFLQELQDQISNADNESICTRSSSTSICSSPGDAEFFAELFTPSPMDNPANDSRYLEMLADGYGISADHSQQTNGHNLTTDNSGSPKSTSGSNSCLKTSTLHNSTAEESLNLMSSSTLAMLNEDNEYFPPFDEIF